MLTFACWKNSDLELYCLLKLSSGIPDLQSERDLEALEERLHLKLSDEEAAAHFKRLIYASMRARTTRLNEAAHLLRHA